MFERFPLICRCWRHTWANCLTRRSSSIWLPSSSSDSRIPPRRPAVHRPQHHDPNCIYFEFSPVLRSHCSLSWKLVTWKLHSNSCLSMHFVLSFRNYLNTHSLADYMRFFRLNTPIFYALILVMWVLSNS